MNAEVGHDLMTVLNLSPRDTSLALALFYVAYVVFDCPSNLLMSKLSPRVWMTRIVFATSVVGACFAAVEDAWSLMLLRFLLGVVIAGMWPGMAYYLTLFYPPSRTGKRIGYYFTASQVSASVVGLVSAGFQLMDGLGGLVGFRWMFLIYGLVGIVLSFFLLWWLPERPLAPGQVRERTGLMKWLPKNPEVLSGQDAVVHYQDLKRVYHARPWNLRDLGLTLIDWRLWPLTLMYFGVVGVGIGTQMYGSVIIRSIQPEASSIEVSLLFAPIWIVSLPATYPRLRLMVFLDGPNRNFARYAAVGPFPPLAPVLLHCCCLHSDYGTSHHHFCDLKRMGPLWRPSHGWLRSRSHCAHLHGLVLGDLPAPPR